MTDKEIIKALECHVSPNKCNECPYVGIKSGYCSMTMIKNALDLIRRQQAEIEHFVEANKMIIEPKTVKTENEVFKLLVNQSVTFIPKNDDIKAIQRDAVINFAERVKDNLRNVAKVEIMGCEYYLIGLPFIDNLVSEMFGNPEQVEGE